MRVYEPYLKIMIPWSLFFFTVFFYLDNICPTISWRDSPEFVTVSHNLDISHPAGSPTYSLSSKLLTLIPIGNIALRVNLFSSISSSLCIALIFVFLYHIMDYGGLRERIVASTGGSLSLICCQAFGIFSSVAEVYSFQNFFLILLLIIVAKSHSSISLSHMRFKYCFAFLYGISLGVHASMAIFVPAFLIYIFISDKGNFEAKKIAFMLFFSILGFLIYTFLPFRSISTLVFDWGNPETLYQFLSQIFDQKDSNKEIYHTINFSIYDFRLYVDHLIDEFSSILCLIGVIGFFRILTSRFHIAILLFIIFLSNIIFFINAGWTVSWGFIPSFLIFSIFIGNGIYFFIDTFLLLITNKNNYFLLRHLKYINTSIIILMIFFLIKSNRILELKNDYSTKFFATKILSELPSDSILFSEYMWFPLLYMQQIEHRRPDLTFILQGEVFFPEYFEAISKKRFPNIRHIDTNRNNNRTTYEYFLELSKANLVDQSLFLEPDGQFQKLVTDYISPYGLLFSFDPYKKREITKNEIEKMNTYLDSLLKEDMKSIKNIEGEYYIANKINYIANFWSELQNEDQVLKAYDTAVKAWPQGETINNNYGAYLMSKGYISKASNHLKKSYEISPYNLAVYKNLANLMFRIKDYHSSLYLLENFIKKSRKVDEDIAALLGATYYELERYNHAEKYLDTAIDIIKNKTTKNTENMNDDNKFKWIKLYKEFCFEKLMI